MWSIGCGPGLNMGNVRGLIGYYRDILGKFFLMDEWMNDGAIQWQEALQKGQVGGDSVLLGDPLTWISFLEWLPLPWGWRSNPCDFKADPISGLFWLIPRSPFIFCLVTSVSSVFHVTSLHVLAFLPGISFTLFTSWTPSHHSDATLIIICKEMLRYID